MTTRPSSSSEVRSGLVVVDKPAGMTSHDVVAKVRRTLGTRKVGHAGTLDPMATGVLVLGYNKATRLLGHLMLTDKTYDATVRLGVTTTTDDAEGEVTAVTSAATVTPDAVRDALAAFVGEIEQVPSTVSAIKVDGKRAYARARAGETVELKARPVTIHAIEASDFRYEGECLDFALTVSCSTGTYIRAVARDLGAALGVGGHLTALRRTSVGPFGVETASTDLADLEAGKIPLARAARELFPSVDVDAATAQAISFGKRLDVVLPSAEGPVALLGPDGEFLALYEQRDNGAVPVAVMVSAS